MGGYIWVFPHPYFAVTDKDGSFEISKVMPGKYRLISWHEEKGWLTGGESGIEITIRADEVNQVGQLKLKLD